MKSAVGAVENILFSTAFFKESEFRFSRLEARIEKSGNIEQEGDYGRIFAAVFCSQRQYRLPGEYCRHCGYACRNHLKLDSDAEEIHLLSMVYRFYPSGFPFQFQSVFSILPAGTESVRVPVAAVEQSVA